HAIWTQYAQDTSAPVQAGLAEGNKIAAFAGNQLSMFFTDVEHPIVYVRSTSGTRLLPYSSVPLISIPPTAVIVGDGTLRVCDAMSILHELGHFLFWRGALPGSGEPIHTDLGARLEALRASNNRCLHWVEEIFADVVAALLGGPYAVRCLMDMQREKVGRLFVQDDGHYPIPAVRPFAALHVLDLLGVDITEMETRWTTTTLKSWLPKKIGFDPQDPDSYGLSLRMMEQAVVREEPATVASPNLKNIREDVMAIAQLVYDMLSEGMTTSIIAQFTDVWRSRYEQGASGEDVVEAMRSAAPMSAATASRHWVKWHAAVAQDRLKSNQTALQSTDTFNDLKWVTDVLSTPEIDDTQGESQAMFKLTLDEWRDILYFGGWGDAGPTGGSPHEID
ncbi:MAG: hypothetical protein KDD84_24510, partial [Caldilineaceae bacterium]|nr:hypothetical protein [Caldilineaceae bacterium]